MLKTSMIVVKILAKMILPIKILMTLKALMMKEKVAQV